MVGVRMSEDLQKEVRAWAHEQDDGPALATAIRRLVEIGLTKSSPTKGRCLTGPGEGAGINRACGDGSCRRWHLRHRGA